MAEYMRTHGVSDTKLYRIWTAVKQRCLNPKNLVFKYYGQRGISICEEWESFPTFQGWALENGYEEHLSLDRISNDGDYTPENCRWVTVEVQRRNTRKLKSTNTSGYRGVSFHKRHQKWLAGICVNTKQIHLGCFETPEEAAHAYDQYVIDNSLEHTINFEREEP